MAYEGVCSLESAIQEFFRARSALNEWRRSIPSSRWLEANSPADLDYELSIFRMQGASYALVSAARHIVRILDADPALGRLPGALHVQVHQLRNVIEHWDEWTKSEARRGGRMVPTSAARLRAIKPDVWPFGFKFTHDMDYLVGDMIPLSHLREVLAALWLWQRALAEPHGGEDHPSPLVTPSPR